MSELNFDKEQQLRVLGSKIENCKLFNDYNMLKEEKYCKIDEITVFYNEIYIVGLQIQYLNLESKTKILSAQYKGKSTRNLQCQTIRLQKDEFITEVNILANVYIENFVLLTSKMKCYNIGGIDGNHYSIKCRNGFTIGAFAGGYMEGLNYLELQETPIPKFIEAPQEEEKLSNSILDNVLNGNVKTIVSGISDKLYSMKGISDILQPNQSQDKQEKTDLNSNSNKDEKSQITNNEQSNQNARRSYLSKFGNIFGKFIQPFSQKQQEQQQQQQLKDLQNQQDVKQFSNQVDVQNMNAQDDKKQQVGQVNNEEKENNYKNEIQDNNDQQLGEEDQMQQQNNQQKQQFQQQNNYMNGKMLVVNEKVNSIFQSRSNSSPALIQHQNLQQLTNQKINDQQFAEKQFAKSQIYQFDQQTTGDDVEHVININSEIIIINNHFSQIMSPKIFKQEQLQDQEEKLNNNQDQNQQNDNLQQQQLSVGMTSLFNSIVQSPNNKFATNKQTIKKSPSMPNIQKQQLVNSSQDISNQDDDEIAQTNNIQNSEQGYIQLCRSPLNQQNQLDDAVFNQLKLKQKNSSSSRKHNDEDVDEDEKQAGSKQKSSRSSQSPSLRYKSFFVNNAFSSPQIQFITVSNPEVQQEQSSFISMFKKSIFVQYTLTIMDNQDQLILVKRQGSHFNQLHQALIAQFPGLPMPYMSKKCFTQNFSPEIIESRREIFEKYCKDITSIAFLFYSKPFQIFLNNNVQDDSVKEQESFKAQERVTQTKKIEQNSLQQLKELADKPNYSEILSYMNQWFEEYLPKPLNKEIYDKFDAFRVYLTEEKQHLTELCQRVLEINQFINDYHQKMSGLKKGFYFDLNNWLVNNFQDYNSAFKKIIDQKTNKPDDIQQTSYQDGLEELYQMAQMQLRKIESYQIAFEQLEIIDNSYIQQEQLNNQKNVEVFKQIKEIVQKIFGYHLIDQYNTEKQLVYEKTINKASLKEIFSNHLIVKLWNFEKNL